MDLLGDCGRRSDHILTISWKTSGSYTDHGRRALQRKRAIWHFGVFLSLILASFSRYVSWTAKEAAVVTSKQASSTLAPGAWMNGIEGGLILGCHGLTTRDEHLSYRSAGVWSTRPLHV